MSNLTVQTGVTEAEQSAFENATLSGFGDGQAISIAVRPPSDPFIPDEELLRSHFEDVFESAMRLGYEIEIQVGPGSNAD